MIDRSMLVVFAEWRNDGAAQLARRPRDEVVALPPGYLGMIEDGVHQVQLLRAAGGVDVLLPVSTFQVPQQRLRAGSLPKRGRACTSPVPRERGGR